MPRETRWARDGPSRRAPGAMMERGNPAAGGAGCRGQAFLVTFSATGKSNPPSRAELMFQQTRKRAAARNQQHQANAQGISPSPLPLSHSGEGFRAPNHSRSENLSPPSRLAPILTPPRPRGAAIRRYAVGGAGAAPAGGVATHFREASGHRPGDITIPVRGARWKARDIQGLTRNG